MRRTRLWCVASTLALTSFACFADGDPAAADHDAATPAGGGDAGEGTSAFVDLNVAVDSDCIVDPAGTHGLAIGQYDIAEAGMRNGDPESTPCANAYVLNLRVNSHLRPEGDSELGRVEPSILRIDSAEVTLMTLRKETLVFEGLPNPFRVVTAATLPPTTDSEPTAAIATIEAIPSAHASSLHDFVDSQILIETQLFGTTTGGVDVDLEPFIFTVEICDGCLTLCRDADFLSTGIQPADLTEGTCTAPSLAGMDGRFCIDPGC